MSIFQSVEEIIAVNSETWLEHLLLKFSTDIRIIKPVQTTHRTVYGNEAGEEAFSEKCRVDGIVTSDDFYPTDAYSAGSFQEGWLYVRATDDVNVGDRIEISRQDGRTRRFKVEKSFGIGVSTSVFKRFRIAALGD